MMDIDTVLYQFPAVPGRLVVSLLYNQYETVEGGSVVKRDYYQWRIVDTHDGFIEWQSLRDATPYAEVGSMVAMVEKFKSAL